MNRRILQSMGRAAGLAIIGIAAILFAVGAHSIERPGTPSCIADWRNDHWCGWHFYDDPEVESPAIKEAPKKPEVKPLPKPEVKPPGAPELQIIKEQQRRLEDLRHVAIVTPSEENVRRYLEFEQFIYRQANTFSEVARRVGMTLGPLLPEGLARPTNSLAAKVFDEQKFKGNTARLDQLKDTHALFYFFRSDCAYCQTFSPIVARFEKQMGVKVIAISLDGRGTPEFPSFRRDNGIATTLKVDAVPSLYLAEPATSKVIALGSGVMSHQQLLERIALAVDPDTERLAPGLISTVNLR